MPAEGRRERCAAPLRPTARQWTDDVADADRLPGGSSERPPPVAERAVQRRRSDDPNARASTAASNTVPWMACAAAVVVDVVEGELVDDPSNANRPSRIRPTHGAIGYEPQPIAGAGPAHRRG